MGAQGEGEGARCLPVHHRALICVLQSGATALSAAARARGVSYSDILSRVPSELSDAFAKDIEVDLGRTFPEHPMFSPGPSEGGQGDATLGVERLRRILSAYCVLHPEAGYLQSMNFAAAFLCVVLGDEEAAFYTLLALTDNCLQGYYELDMPALRADSAVFEEALKRVAPHIHAHATKLNFEVQFVLPRWLLCGFLHCLPFEVTVRVWDCMMVAGRQAPRVLAQVCPPSPPVCVSGCWRGLCVSLCNNGACVCVRVCWRKELCVPIALVLACVVLVCISVCVHVSPGGPGPHPEPCG